MFGTDRNMHRLILKDRDSVQKGFNNSRFEKDLIQNPVDRNRAEQRENTPILAAAQCPTN